MELRTCPPDFSITSSMKHSTSCSHRDSSRPYCEVMVSCLRRLINSAACFTMIDSDRASISLCHEVNTRAAFACARFAYSLAKSCVKFRPVVRTGSVSLGGGRGLPESTFMPLVFAIVPRPCRSVFVVLCALSNATLEPGCRLSCSIPSATPVTGTTRIADIQQASKVRSAHHRCGIFVGVEYAGP